MKSLPVLDKMDKKTNHLVICDDLLLDKDQQPIINYYIRCRKLNCSIAVTMMIGKFNTRHFAMMDFL
jgi:hypothetical protein